MERGADPRLQSETDFSPLYVACRAGFVALAELLLSKDAAQTEARFRPGPVSEGNSSSVPPDSQREDHCSSAVESDKERSHSPSIDGLGIQTEQPTGYRTESAKVPKSKSGRPPFPEINACLRVAAQEGHCDIILLLTRLGDGINPHDRNSEDGETALHRSASQGHADIVAALIANNFQASARNKLGMNALQLAARFGDLRTVKVLVQHGTRVNNLDMAPTSATYTSEDNPAKWEPLELASQLGHMKVVMFLLEHEAQPTKKAFDLAAMHGHTRVLCALTGAVQTRIISGLDPDELIISAVVIAVQKGYVHTVSELVTPNLVQKIHEQGKNFLLHLAARNVRDRIIRILVGKGFSCDATDQDKNTALHTAAASEKLSCIDALIDLGADKDKYNGEKETPLYWAANEGKAQAARRLLENQAQPDLLCGSGSGSGPTACTALYRACSRGHVDVVRCLLEFHANHNIGGAQGWTVLHAAHHNKMVAELLLDRHPELVSLRNDFESTALVLAAQKGYDAVVTLLLERGTDINMQNKSGSSALHRAATEGHEHTVRLLVEPPWCANPDITKKDGAAPLHLAAFRGHFSVVRYLVDKVASINVQSEAYGTPLCAAVISAGYHRRRWIHSPTSGGWDEIAKFLLEGHKADPNSLGGPFHSPLQAAAGFGHIDMVRLLFIHKANPNAVGGNHGTALLAAIRGRHDDLIQTLLNHGADPNVPFKGKLPLEAAFEAGNEVTVLHLLKQSRTDSTDGDENKTQPRKPLVMGGHQYGMPSAWAC